MSAALLGADALLTDHYAALLHFARSQTVSDPAYEYADLLHDAIGRFLTIGAIARCDTEEHALHYLMRSIHLRARDLGRRATKHPHEEMGEHHAEPGSGMEAEAIARGELGDILASLLPRDTGLILMALGYKVEEIAALVGVEASTVKTRVHRWRARHGKGLAA